MGMIVTRRNAEFSLFKAFLMMLLKICDPDEVWFTSRRMDVGLSEAKDGSGKTVKELLIDKNVKKVHLVTNNYEPWAQGRYQLKKELESKGLTVDLKEVPYWDVNEIYLKKEGKVVAAITGSSECVTWDLDDDKFKIKTDVIFFGSEYDEQIRKACDEDRDVRVAILDYGSICICDGGFDLDRMFNDMKNQKDKVYQRTRSYIKT